VSRIWVSVTNNCWVAALDKAVYWRIMPGGTTDSLVFSHIDVFLSNPPKQSSLLHIWAWHGPPTENTLLLSNRYHVLLSGMSTHALPSSGYPTVAHLLLWYVFSGLLPSTGCSLVGTCLHICLLETAQSVTIAYFINQVYIVLLTYAYIIKFCPTYIRYSVCSERKVGS
jgi:hypothetical protein